jgi:poly(A) polymerase
MTKLPANNWTARPGLAKLTAALGADNLRWVGGAVRDTLLGHDIYDVDAATRLLPGVVVDKCAAAGIKTVPTGLQHGTVTAVLDDGPVEVTTLRCDFETDGRHAKVEFAEDWRDDAARRDFTINALYAHPDTLEVSDYFGGLEDLKARRVRFIGDAERRIREDHLRILRYFRFQARFGDDFDPEALAACTSLADTLKGLSRERIGGELLTLLGLPDPARTVRKMAEAGVLSVILPEARARELDVLDDLVRREQAHGAGPEALRRLAALIPAIPSLAETVSARLRLSRQQRARLVCAAERKDTDADNPRRLAYCEGMACARDRLLLLGGPTEELDDWDVPQFTLKGGEVVASGVTAGPAVARVIQAVERRWLDEGFPDRERIDALLGEELARLEAPSA